MNQLPRRQFLCRSFTAAAASIFLSALPRLRADDHAAPAGPFSLPPLPYRYDALTPHIDEQTMRIHHGRHHAGYTRKLNAALNANGAPYRDTSIEALLAQVGSLPQALDRAIEQNGGGFWNHTFFWESMTPNSPTEPTGDLADAIAESFGSFAGFKSAFIANASGVFGSGWGWLVLSRQGVLKLTQTPNQHNPLMTQRYPAGDRPLLGVDVWEHAYYLNYQNRRADYLEAWFNVIAWEKVAQRFQSAA